MGTRVWDQGREWIRGGSGVTVKGKTWNCDNPSLSISQIRTLRESWVERYLLGLGAASAHPPSFFLYPCPLLPWLETVLGRMPFVQPCAPPGCFRQAKVWGGVAGRCPPRAISVRASRVRKQRKLSKVTPEINSVAEDRSVGSTVSECPLPNTFGTINL